MPAKCRNENCLNEGGGTPGTVGNSVAVKASKDRKAQQLSTSRLQQVQYQSLSNRRIQQISTSVGIWFGASHRHPFPQADFWPGKFRMAHDPGRTGEPPMNIRALLAQACRRTRRRNEAKSTSLSARWRFHASDPRISTSRCGHLPLVVADHSNLQQLAEIFPEGKYLPKSPLNGEGLAF